MHPSQAGQELGGEWRHMQLTNATVAKCREAGKRGSQGQGKEGQEGGSKAKVTKGKKKES